MAIEMEYINFLRTNPPKINERFAQILATELDIETKGFSGQALVNEVMTKINNGKIAADFENLIVAGPDGFKIPDGLADYAANISMETRLNDLGISDFNTQQGLKATYERIENRFKASTANGISNIALERQQLKAEIERFEIELKNIKKKGTIDAGEMIVREKSRLETEIKQKTADLALIETELRSEIEQSRSILQTSFDTDTKAALADFEAKTKTLQASGDVMIKSKAKSMCGKWCAGIGGFASLAVGIVGVVMATGEASEGVGFGLSENPKDDATKKYKKCLSKLEPQYSILRLLNICYQQQRESLILEGIDFPCDSVPTRISACR